MDTAWTIAEESAFAKIMEQTGYTRLEAIRAWKQAGENAAKAIRYAPPKATPTAAQLTSLAKARAVRIAKRAA